jgi:hypothetical protein
MTRILTLLYILSSFRRGFGIYQALRGFPDPARACKGPASRWLANYQLGLATIHADVRRDDGWAAIAKREVLTSVTAVFEPHRSRETSGAETIIPACTSRLLGKRGSVRLFLGSTGMLLVTRIRGVQRRLTPARPQSGKRKLQA